MENTSFNTNIDDRFDTNTLMCIICHDKLDKQRGLVEMPCCNNIYMCIDCFLQTIIVNNIKIAPCCRRPLNFASEVDNYISNLDKSLKNRICQAERMEHQIREREAEFATQFGQFEEILSKLQKAKTELDAALVNEKISAKTAKYKRQLIQALDRSLKQQEETQKYSEQLAQLEIRKQEYIQKKAYFESLTTNDTLAQNTLAKQIYARERELLAKLDPKLPSRLDKLNKQKRTGCIIS